MDELYRPAVFGITAAITFIMVINTTRKVIGNSGIKGMVTALDYINMPGHDMEILRD